MKNRVAQIALTLGVALLAMPALAQTPESFTNSTPAPVAYVYIQTNPGVIAYSAAANGTLTLVKGSPFPVSGQMEDIGGKFLISVGTTLIHVYQIEPNGGVGKQISQTSTASYGGSECGATSGQGSVLDHTGKYLYVQLFNTGGDCSSWQTYKVESDGHLQFEGDVDSKNFDDYNESFQSTTVPTVSSNDKFLYGSVPYWDDKGLFAPYFAAFTKSSNGVLEVNGSFSETDPPPYGDYSFYSMAAAADPYGHLAVLMSAVDEPGGAYYGQPWLASYTINPSTGAVLSTNTESDMPHTAGDAGNSNLRDKLSMSPAGNVVAVAEYPGIQIFHFNGAAPITSFSNFLLDSGADFDRLAWDSHNHLYALSFSSNQLHVLTVTPTAIVEAPGSTYTLPKSPYGTKGIVVVPK